MDLVRLSVPQRLSGGCMMAVALGAFLPWVSASGALGVQGDGVMTLLLAIVGLAVLLLTSGVIGPERPTSRAWSALLLVFALLVTSISVIHLDGAAFGLYLTLAVGLAWVMAAVWQLCLPREPAPPIIRRQLDDL